MGDLYFLFSIRGVLIDLICHIMPKIIYEEGGNHSYEMRGCFLPPSLSLFMSSGFVFVQTDNESGV